MTGRAAHAACPVMPALARSAVKKSLRIYVRLMDGINHVVGLVLALMLAVMSVLITWQVFARFVAGNSLTFSEEVSRFLMIWLTLLGAAYAVRRGTLLAVDLLPDLLKGRTQKTVKVAAHLLSLTFYVVLIYFGWNIAQTVSYQTAPATGLSMRWPMLALSAGGVLMLLNTLAVMIEETVPGMTTHLAPKGLDDLDEEVI
jgi:TRAP-type transport system small permease protein